MDWKQLDDDTRAAEVPGGVLVQVASDHRAEDRGGLYLTHVVWCTPVLVPGARIESTGATLRLVPCGGCG